MITFLIENINNDLNHQSNWLVYDYMREHCDCVNETSHWLLWLLWHSNLTSIPHVSQIVYILKFDIKQQNAIEMNVNKNNILKTKCTCFWRLFFYVESCTNERNWHPDASPKPCGEIIIHVFFGNMANLIHINKYVEWNSILYIFSKNFPVRKFQFFHLFLSFFCWNPF